MARMPQKVAQRLASGLKKFQQVIQSAKVRDVNEADTVVIITDMLSEILGYEKYTEITKEHAIRGTYCDLAIKIGEDLALLIECKAVGVELRELQIRQGVNYAANEGVEWVVLTNAHIWKVFKVNFGKPVTNELVLDVDFLSLDPKKENDLTLLWLLAKEGLIKARLGEFYSQRQALSRFTIAAILLTDPLLSVIRRELRRVSPDAKIEDSQIVDVLQNEVFKREIIEGDQAIEAKRLVARAAKRTLRVAPAETDVTVGPPIEPFGNDESA